MKNYHHDIHQKIEELPADLRHEVEIFIDSVSETKKHGGAGSPRFDWEGALKDLKDEYTSVELQHKILEMRGE